MAPAARAMAPKHALRPLIPVAALASLVVLVFACARGPVAAGAPSSLVKGAVRLADGTPVLADGSIDEQVALAGGRIWVGDPIDAFSPAVQASYLDWLAGNPSGAGAVVRSVKVVLVARGSRTQQLMARMPEFAPTRSDASTVLYERTSA